MAEFKDFIRSIQEDGNDGKAFERFCKWFLEHDHYWKTQTEKVWLWDDWPDRWDKDKGIDLVFRHINGELWAVQSKCYDSSYSIKKEDVDSFLSESNRAQISKRLLIASTNRLGKNAIETIEGQEKPVIRFLLDDFNAANVSYPSKINDLSTSRP